MLPKWIRTYPLQGLHWLLSKFIKPWSEARTLEQYATNGYLYLLGSVLILLTFALWGFGVLTWSISHLPAWLRDILRMKGIPETMPLIAALAFLYGSLYFVKSIRLFLGEWFATVFFGIASIGIAAGEWCLEHRWASLVIVIGLAGVITWGTYYLVETKLRHDNLASNFQHWLDQVDHFSARSTVSQDESYGYKAVSAFWLDDYTNVVDFSGNQPHPSLLLHKMLDQLYLKPPPPDWHDFLRRSLLKLTELMAEYRPTGQEMTPEHKRAWALMNILMGRIYVRLSDGCSECSELVEAKKYFSAISAQHMSSGDKRYHASAHNGLGTVYGQALTSMLQNGTTHLEKLQSICRTPIECANLAFEEYTQVEGDVCSFEGRRRENNTADTLVRIGLNYEELRSTDMNLACGKYIKNGGDLADCIEARIKRMMGCTAKDPFVPLLFITVAQAYGVNVELRRRANPNAKVEREAIDAGSYLRLAYILNKDAQENMKYWGFCYFRFAVKDEKLGSIFLQAATTGFHHSPAPDADYLNTLIKKDVDKLCPLTQ